MEKFPINPPIPPPQTSHTKNPPTHTTNKDNQLSSPNIAEYLNFYKKDTKETYWFQRIPEESYNKNKPHWNKLIMKSIIDYGAYMLEHNLINKEHNDELNIYISMAYKYIDSHK